MAEHARALHEQAWMGTLFPMGIAQNRMPSPSNDDVLIYIHWHEFLEFIYFEGGSAVVTVDSRRYEVSDGDAILVNPGEVHTAHASSHSKVVAHAIVFSPEILAFSYHDTCQDALIAPLLQGRLKLPSHLSTEVRAQREVIREIKELIHADREARPGYQLHCKACVFKAISLVAASELLSASTPQPPGERTDRTILLKRVLKHIEENYSSGIRVGDLAAIAGLSEDHFYKAFKRMTGKTPISYLNGCRVLNAIRLMSEKGLSVTDAALEVGFENVSYFIRVFKKQTGVTPARYVAGPAS